MVSIKKRRLEEELKQRRYKPISSYLYSNHGWRDKPVDVINKLYKIQDNVPIRVKEVWKIYDRDDAIKLYNILNSNAQITHEDIVSLYNNPYLNTISNWNSISTTDKYVIKREYPGIDRLANEVRGVKNDFVNVLTKTTPEVRTFINDFAIPITITSKNNNNSLLSRVTKKVVSACHRYNDFTERAWEIGWLHSVYEDDTLMNAEERQAFKEWVINREIREQQNGFIEVLGSVLNVTEVLGVTSSLKVFKATSATLQQQSSLIRELVNFNKNVAEKLIARLNPKEAKITWGLWEDLPKVVHSNGKTYAKIGNYYYSHHAVDYMMPKSVAKDLGITNEVRGIPHSVVENTIKYGTKTQSNKATELRYLYSKDDVTVVTDATSRIIISLGKRTK